jgi:hypothetical protein
LTFLGYSLTVYSSKIEKTMQVITKSAVMAFIFNMTFTALVSATNEPIIIAQPNNITQCMGGTEVLKVAISANLTVIYQWQQSSDNANWVHIKGATHAVYTPESQNIGKMWYRVLVTTQGENSKAAASQSAEVMVVESPKVSITAVASKSVNAYMTFIATRTGGAGRCTLQWQISENNAPWKDIEGATGNEFKTAVSAAKGTAKYKAVQRCTGSGCCK